MINVNHSLGRVDDARLQFRRLLEAGPDVINRDCNYVPMLNELAYAAVAVGREDDMRDVYDRLIPYAGLHAAPYVGYFGPTHYPLALLRRALGDLGGAKNHLAHALANVQRIEARPWIEKIRRERL